MRSRQGWSTHFGIPIVRELVQHLPMATALGLFAHKALAPLFHRDPKRFVAMLDGDGAVPFLEQAWRWALEAAGQQQPARPPLRYGIDRPREGLAIVWMNFQDVQTTGEPWHVRFIVRDPDSGLANGYTRMFLLEHSEYSSERRGRPQAMVCESEADGKHRNWSVTMAPDDVEGFDRVVIDTLRKAAGPTTH